MNYPEVHLALLGVLLAVACAGDVAQRRIPNAVVAAIAVAGLAAQWASRGIGAALEGGLTGAVVVAILLLPWATGKMGGGDLKLAAATAIWVGLSRLPSFLVFVGLAGLPLALATRLAHRFALWRLLRQASPGDAWPEAVAVPRETVPVAVAIALGAVAALQGGLSW